MSSPVNYKTVASPSFSIQIFGTLAVRDRQTKAKTRIWFVFSFRSLFSTKYNWINLILYLRSHSRSVHEKVKYPCNLCQHSATAKRDVRRHIESVREKVKYPCNQCEYQASLQSSLRTHIESVHQKIKYPCHQCDYNFTRKCQYIWKLNIHVINVNLKSEESYWISSWESQVSLSFMRISCYKSGKSEDSYSVSPWECQVSL